MKSRILMLSAIVILSLVFSECGGGAVDWTDASGNFWLFGGVFFDLASGSVSYFNDLWEYSPTTGEWAWMAGSASQNQSGTYGTQGTAAPATYPGDENILLVGPMG